MNFPLLVSACKSGRRSALAAKNLASLRGRTAATLLTLHLWKVLRRLLLGPIGLVMGSCLLSGCISAQPDAEKRMLLSEDTEASGSIPIRLGAMPAFVVVAVLGKDDGSKNPANEEKVDSTLDSHEEAVLLDSVADRLRGFSGAKVEIGAQYKNLLANSLLNDCKATGCKDQDFPEKITDPELLSRLRGFTHLLFVAGNVSRGKLNLQFWPVGGYGGGGLAIETGRKTTFSVAAFVYDAADGRRLVRLRLTEDAYGGALWPLLPVPVLSVRVDVDVFLKALGNGIGEEVGRRFEVIRDDRGH